MPALVWRGRRSDLVAALAALPEVLAGGRPDPLGLARGLQLRVGVAVLSKVQQAFLVKSRGGTGSDGVRWPPLAKRTLTAARTGGAGTADVLRDTGALLRSLSPGVADRPSGEREQLFALVAGGVVVGSTCPYAAYHQAGTPTLPARPIFPADGRLPEAWAADVAEAAATGLARAVELLVANGGVG